MPLPHLMVPVREDSQVGEARRTAIRIADAAGLNETDRGRAAIVVTELANNVFRHAGGGEILLAPLTAESGIGIEILALDKGPGMSDIGRCLEDGYSTGGTAGTGLGAARRLSDVFDIFSTQPGGTGVLSRVLSAPAKADSLSYSAVRLCAPGEIECGDNWSLARHDQSLSLVLADGLGHGPIAAIAANEIVRLFDENPTPSPAMFLQSAHAPMRTTRGAAVATARIDLAARSIVYAGAGNISGWIIANDGARALMSHNGTVGLELRKVQEFEYKWPAGALLVMHSDGLQSRWTLERLPGLARRHPALIAGLLYRDFGRGRDDLTVVVLQAG